jgi:hypothetical protein
MDNIKEAERLIKKFNAYRGMMAEILMKTTLLKNKVKAAMRAGDESEELAETVNNSLIQYRSDLSKYKKKMRRIYRRVEELCR